MKSLKFTKTETQLFVERFLSQDDLNGMSQTISSAYSAVNNLYRMTPALGAFIVGSDIRPHLIRITVEHLLQRFADTNVGFTHEVRPNIAKNCNHLRLYKNGLALTSNYMGAYCERPRARKALHKANLSERNMDLFEFENNDLNLIQDARYAEIMHGGITKPINILINIPSRDQLGTIGSIAIAIFEENKTLVEQIADEPPFNIKNIIEELKNGNQKKTS